MKTNITDIELRNWTRDNPIALLRHGSRLPLYGEIMNISEMGTTENTIHWEENLNGETRNFINSQINAMTYVVTVLSKDYDISSKTGDTMLIRIEKNNVKMDIWGVLTKVTRNRFERAQENTCLYKTEYEIYYANPLWRFEDASGPVEPSEYEPDNMELLWEGTFDMTQSLSSLTMTIDSAWFNTKRGFKMEMVFNTAYEGDKPLTAMNMTIMPADYVFSMTPQYADWGVGNAYYCIFGQSLIQTNMTPASSNQWTSSILTEYTNGNPVLLSPASWDDENKELKLIQVSHYSSIEDLTLSVKIYIEKGWYF